MIDILNGDLVTIPTPPQEPTETHDHGEGTEDTVTTESVPEPSRQMQS